MHFLIINDTSATPQYDLPKIRTERQTDGQGQCSKIDVLNVLLRTDIN